jgi:hypothetical protein
LNMTAFWDVAPCSLVEVDWLYTLLEIFSKKSRHFRRFEPWMAPLCIRVVPNPSADVNKGRRWSNQQFLVLHSKANEVGGACGTHGRGEKSVQGFGGKARRKETTGKTKA